MNRTLKVSFACAFGAGIGAMIALQIGGYLWWIGMLIGATLGYLSYEFKAVLKAIVYAWKKTITYRPDWAVVKKGVNKGLILTFWVIMGFTGYISSMYLLLSIPICSNFGEELRGFIVIYLLTIGAASTAAAADGVARGRNLHKKIILSVSPFFAFVFWPVAAIVFIAITLLKVIVATIKTIIKFTPKAVRAIFAASLTVASFFKTIFVQIHSDERLLCFFDAGIGSAIGYYYHYALIGALAGGILGVINYEVVSKILLKLVPAKS